MDVKFMQLAIDAAKKGLEKVGHGPFGACIVKGEKVIAVTHNKVVANNDPTAHAEVNAIRMACKKLNTFDLKGCEIYSTCEPCPMCLGAIYWARLDALYYGCTRFEAAEIGFDDQLIYDELDLPIARRKLPTTVNVMHPECQALFTQWRNKNNRVDY